MRPFTTKVTKGAKAFGGFPKQFFVYFVSFVVSVVLAHAHRLDEYLQAARIGVETDRVTVELDLTPGVSVARQVFASVDSDSNGVVSSDEAAAYGRAVLADTSLEVDGTAQPLSLDACRVAPMADMAEGLGAIRVIAKSVAVPAGAGAHHLLFRNRHRPELSVYLANALAPSAPGLEIVRQTRDPRQREIRIDYRLAPAVWGASRGWPLAAATATIICVCALAWTRRQRP